MKTGYKLFLSLCLMIALSPHLQAMTHHEIDPFDEISVTGNVEIYLEKGEKVGLEVEDDDALKIDVDNGLLRIKRKKLYDIDSYGDDEAIKVRVSYTVLRKIKGNAGAEFYSKTAISGDQLFIKLGSGAEGTLAVDVNKVEIMLGEGAQLEIEGRATDQESYVSTGAVLEGFKLKSENTYIKASTGGEAEVYASVRLEANAHTGGDIEYKGDPAKVKISDNLGGEVSNHR